MTHREQQRRIVEQFIERMQREGDTGQLVVHLHKGEVKKIEPRPVYQVPQAGDLASEGV